MIGHSQRQEGAWLMLAKKGTTEPTTLTYAQALDEALCSGWIDGQKRSFDAATFLQRFTPRRPCSIWSARNVEHVARLQAEGRMRDRGLAEVAAAQVFAVLSATARHSILRPILSAPNEATRTRRLAKAAATVVAVCAQEKANK
ncbi:YdeI/OmpD-associated family protein [Jonesiaceae bacterium BS-20]|uniref:YdeI/OmpD-associated family protein n=1 Tax=Jonesiaceae bacterium BS-20 TaxID=3120821 RepID=A0AAU7DUB7_9MICO